MKHTDLYNEYKKLDAIERNELEAAVKAHGGEYVFLSIDEDGDYDMKKLDSDTPIVAASTRYMDSYEDFYITRVVLKNEKYLTIYGILKEYLGDECELESVAHGHLGYITDCIPETDEVKDVSISSDKNKLYRIVCNLSEMLGEIACHDDWGVTSDEIDTLYGLASEARDLMENGHLLGCSKTGL